MRILVTGASGFIGSHTVSALVEGGYRPRLLVRNAEAASAVLAGVGVDSGRVDFVPGDMRDAEAVGAALDGCDAVVHAAAVVGITGKPGGEVLSGNVEGTRNVVGGAVEQGISRIVYLSSMTVFMPTDQPVITADFPLSRQRTEYGRSKLEAERYVRGLQNEGAPITTFYPGGVCGPHQSTLKELNEGIAAGLGRVWPLPRGSGVSVLDVRDLAEAILRTVRGPGAPRRWMLGGHHLGWADLADLCDALTGVPCKRMVVPGGLLLTAGSLLDLAKRVRHFDFPLTRDAAEMMVTLPRTDDREPLAELDLKLRPPEETLADILRWMAVEGHLDPARAGAVYSV